MTDVTELLRQAEEFALELAGTVSAFTGRGCGFEAMVRGRKVHISIRDGQTIPLEVDGVAHLSLVISIECSWDSAGDYLAVIESKFAVFAGTQTNKEPLFRYEYVREPVGGVPSAHLQVHAHRDAFTHAMSSAGRKSRRGKRSSKLSPDTWPAVAEFHFPLGGPRFRPCLEDVLEALQLEFGLDTGSGWREALELGREKWRRQQIRSAVRDAPEDAAEVLRTIGYRVVGGSGTDNLTRLKQL